MPAAVISIGDARRIGHEGTWSLLELAPPGCQPLPLGILLVDAETDQLIPRVRSTAEAEAAVEGDLEEQDLDILDFLVEDLRSKAREMGARALVDSLEDSLSGFLRIGNRTAIAWSGDSQRAADRLYDAYVDAALRPFVTHLPLYSLRAAATKFGEGMDSEQEGWIRVNSRLAPDMFVARVVGRSMEPLIPDGSLCVFRHGVKGTRQGKRLLIEKFDETDFAGRYTVKVYSSRKRVSEAGGWEHEEVRLTPLNPEFEAFTLSPDAFRVVAEFVEALDA